MQKKKPTKNVKKSSLKGGLGVRGVGSKGVRRGFVVMQGGRFAAFELLVYYTSLYSSKEIAL